MADVGHSHRLAVEVAAAVVDEEHFQLLEHLLVCFPFNRIIAEAARYLVATIVAVTTAFTVATATVATLTTFVVAVAVVVPTVVTAKRRHLTAFSPRSREYKFANPKKGWHPSYPH